MAAALAAIELGGKNNFKKKMSDCIKTVKRQKGN
jgi:hypothetical protein